MSQSLKGSRCWKSGSPIRVTTSGRDICKSRYRFRKSVTILSRVAFASPSGFLSENDCQLSRFQTAESNLWLGSRCQIKKPPATPIKKSATMSLIEIGFLCRVKEDTSFGRFSSVTLLINRFGARKVHCKYLRNRLQWPDCSTPLLNLNSYHVSLALRHAPDDSIRTSNSFRCIQRIGVRCDYCSSHCRPCADFDYFLTDLAAG